MPASPPPPSRSNQFGELISLRRTSTVEEYQEQFLIVLARCKTLSDEEERDIFTNGLLDPLKAQVELSKPATLDEAMDLARSYEHLAVMSAPPGSPAPSRPWRSARSGDRSCTSSNPDRPYSKLWFCSIRGIQDSTSIGWVQTFKRLSLAEMNERRLQGLCFDCDEKFVPGHRCKKLFACYITVDSDDDQDAAIDGQPEPPP